MKTRFAGQPGTDSVRINPRRVRSLIRKEFVQIVRDPSSIAIALVLPVFLILLIGYGLSLDAKEVPVAVVLENPTPDSAGLAGAFKLSDYFKVTEVTSMQEAVKLIRDQKVDGIVRLSQDFDRQLASGSAPVQLIVRGVDANRGRFIQGYAQGALQQWTNQRAISEAAPSVGSARLQSRMWFNEAVDSHYFLVPGLVVLIMTLTGALLTALVMARRMGTGHPGGAFCHASPGGRDSDRQDPALFPARDDRSASDSHGRTFPVPCPAQGLDLHFVGGLRALPAGGPGIRITHIFGNAQSVRRRPDYDNRDVSARCFPLRVHLRPYRRSQGGSIHQLSAPGKVLRIVFANDLSGRKRVERYPPKLCRYARNVPNSLCAHSAQDQEEAELNDGIVSKDSGADPQRAPGDFE